MADDGSPLVGVDTIEDSTVKVTSFEVVDGEVQEKTEEVPVTQDDLDQLREDIDARVEEVREQFDDPITEDPDIQVKPIEAAQPPVDTSQPEHTEAVADARRIVANLDIEPGDYNTFISAMTDEGHSTEAATEAWHTLRDEAVIGDEPPDRGDGDEDDGSLDDIAEGVGETTEQQQDEDVTRDATQEDDGEDEETEIPAGSDILLVREGDPASEKAITAIGEAVQAMEVFPIAVESEAGRAVLDPLPSDIEIPEHVVAREDTFEVGDLEGLFEEYM